MFDDFDTQICPEELSEYDPEEAYQEYLASYIRSEGRDPDECAKNRAYWGIFG